MAFAEAPSDDQCRDAHLAKGQHKTQTEAAAALGISVPQLKHRAKLYDQRRLSEKPSMEADEIIFPDLPSSELPAEDLIAQACKRFESHLSARDARRWMEIKIKSNKPMAVCFMGDPHIDNNGCNWPLLQRDIGILERTDGLYAVNIGDLTDNWVGRLVRLYADQEMSKKQAWKLAKYLLKD